MRRISIVVAAIFILASVGAEAQVRGGTIGGGGHVGGPVGGGVIGGGVVGGGAIGGGTIGGGNLGGTLGGIHSGPEIGTGTSPVGGRPGPTAEDLDARAVKTTLDDIVSDRLRGIRVGRKTVK
jgi:hypothetical protein